MPKIVLNIEFVDGPCRGEFAIGAEVIEGSLKKALVSRWADGVEHLYWVECGKATYDRTVVNGIH